MRLVVAAAWMVFAVAVLGGCKTRLLDENAGDGSVVRDLGRSTTVDLGGGGFDLAPVGCGPEVDDGKPCGPQGSLCSTGDRCCLCGGLLGFCAQVWVCARPSLNDARCPPSMPPYLGACVTPDGPTCRYCASDGVPWGVGCTRPSIWAECRVTDAPGCWFEAPLGANCD